MSSRVHAGTRAGGRNARVGERHAAGMGVVPPRQVGVSLVELMIAMVLGLVVMGAAFAVFMSNQSTFRASEGLNRIQENARVAFELMARDIRSAGGSACSNASMIEAVDDEGAVIQEALDFRGSPVDGDGSVLTVRSGDDSAYRVVDSTPSSVKLDPDQIADASEAFSAGDLLLLCNARKTFVVAAIDVDGNEVTFDPLPGGYDPANDEFAPPTAVVLARYRDVTWSVKGNSRGGDSLFVTRSGGDDEEVAEDVQSLAFEYLDATTGTYAASPGADVIAVRISMTLTGDRIDGDRLERTTSHVVSMRSRTL